MTQKDVAAYYSSLSRGDKGRFTAFVSLHLGGSPHSWQHRVLCVARNTAIRHTFLWFAVFIIGRGLLWGNIIGIGLVMLQKFTGFVTLDPQTYYVSQAPVLLNIPLVLLLNVATLVVSILFLVGPSYLVARIHPARSMRYE